MTLQELLNSDVGALGASVRQGYDWWIGELAQLVPDRWRRRAAGGRPLVELRQDLGPPRLRRRGRRDEVIGPKRKRALSADLGLGPAQVLTRSVVLPAVGMADLRRLVALELDRLTPFRPDQVYFDIELLERDQQAGRQALRLAVIPRADAEAALEQAARYGVAPLRLGVLDGESLRFDFLPALRAAGRGARANRALTLWWSLAAGLIALNVAVLAIKDMDDVATLRSTVEAQRPMVALALKLRQRVEQEAAVRTTLLARRAHNEPLRIEDAVARAFPSPQWIQRLEWNGRSLRLVGYRDAGFDVLAAARRSGVLGAPRSLSNVDPATAGAKPQFDLIAEPAGEPRR